MRGPGGGGNRDDLPTLRVTNISEDTQENDLRELFGHFGRVARVYVGRDRDTGAGKGFAFVSFEDRAVAQKAMEKVNGKGYDNLILSVQWSREYSSHLAEDPAELDNSSRTASRRKIVDGLLARLFTDSAVHYVEEFVGLLAGYEDDVATSARI